MSEYNYLVSSLGRDPILNANTKLKELSNKLKNTTGIPSNTINSLLSNDYFVFYHSNFKPFVSFTKFYEKIHAKGGNHCFGNSASFIIPHHGDFISDMVLHVELNMKDAINYLDENGVFRQYTPRLRWCNYPGERFLKETRFKINEHLIDKYDSFIYNIYRSIYLQPGKKKLYNKLMGQQDIKYGECNLYNGGERGGYNPGIFGKLDDYRLNNNDYGNNDLYLDPPTQYISYTDGLQTSKYKLDEKVELYIPLLFHFCQDPKFALPIHKIPYSKLEIECDIDDYVKLIGPICNNGKTISTDYMLKGNNASTLKNITDNYKFSKENKITFNNSNKLITNLTLYVNYFNIDEDIIDIISQKTGFLLLRNYIRQNVILNGSVGDINLHNLKWPIESLYFSCKMPEYDESNTAGYYLDSWDKYQMSLCHYTTLKGDGLVNGVESFNQDASDNYAYVEHIDWADFYGSKWNNKYGTDFSLNSYVTDVSGNEADINLEQLEELNTDIPNSKYRYMGYYLETNSFIDNVQSLLGDKPSMIRIRTNNNKDFFHFSNLSGNITISTKNYTNNNANFHDHVGEIIYTYVNMTDMDYTGSFLDITLDDVSGSSVDMSWNSGSEVIMPTLNNETDNNYDIYMFIYPPIPTNHFKSGNKNEPKSHVQLTYQSTSINNTMVTLDTSDNILKKNPLPADAFNLNIMPDQYGLGSNLSKRCIKTFTEIPMIETIKLTYKTFDIIKETNNHFFDRYLPWRFQNNTNSPDYDGLYAINFNLFPNIYQPSGYLDISSKKSLIFSYTSNVIGKTGNNGRLSPNRSTQKGNLHIAAIGLNFLVFDNNEVRLHYSH
tara:strand:- start:6261 stop:8762 length:2502 start_codon:yes stop_codon:yes gene_type:complete